MSPENLDFIALFKASGWSQAEAARELETTGATISRCLSGDQVPSRPLTRLFKEILVSRNPGALRAAGQASEAALADWERRVIDDLRHLHEEDRERVLTAMRAITKALPRREPVKYEIGTAERLAQKAARVAENLIAPPRDARAALRVEKPKANK
jgi:hypothetical protein